MIISTCSSRQHPWAPQHCWDQRGGHHAGASRGSGAAKGPALGDFSALKTPGKDLGRWSGLAVYCKRTGKASKALQALWCRREHLDLQLWVTCLISRRDTAVGKLLLEGTMCSAGFQRLLAGNNWSHLGGDLHCARGGKGTRSLLCYFPASAFLGESLDTSALGWQRALRPSTQGSIKAHHLGAKVTTEDVTATQSVLRAHYYLIWPLMLPAQWAFLPADVTFHSNWHLSWLQQNLFTIYFIKNKAIRINFCQWMENLQQKQKGQGQVGIFVECDDSSHFPLKKKKNKIRILKNDETLPNKHTWK